VSYIFFFALTGASYLLPEFWKNRPAINAAMLAVYEAIKMTENPPQMLIRNLLGQDFGALKATKWPHSRPHMTQRAGNREQISLMTT
jgi:hypothetical protein